MFARVVFSVLLASSLTACSSVSDRYAFWRDQNEPANSAHQPNLGDVPPAPNQDNTLAEIEAIRQRLEQDRNNAYLTTQGVIPNELQQPYYPPVGSTPVAATATPAAPTQTTEQTNIYEQNAIYQSDLESAYPAMTNSAPVSSNQWESGDVAYRYEATNNDQTYTYGHSAVAIRSQGYGAAPMPHYVSNDPSISVDWSALADPSAAVGASATEYNISSIGLNGQPLIFYAHGSSRIGKGDRAKLRQLANELKNTPHSAVIIGHSSVPTGISDPLVSRRINLNMSAKRSIAVVHELNRMGVDMKQLRTAAMGDSFSSGNDTQDRRVDIMLGR